MIDYEERELGITGEKKPRLAGLCVGYFSTIIVVCRKHQVNNPQVLTYTIPTGIIKGNVNNGSGMKTLIQFLNDMDKEDQKSFAIRCGTTIGYLRKACYKGCEIGPEISVNIEKESKGVISRKTLHPKSFMKKWPELAKKSA